MERKSRTSSSSQWTVQRITVFVGMLVCCCTVGIVLNASSQAGAPSQDAAFLPDFGQQLAGNEKLLRTADLQGLERSIAEARTELREIRSEISTITRILEQGGTASSIPLTSLKKSGRMSVSEQRAEPLKRISSKSSTSIIQQSEVPPHHELFVKYGTWSGLVPPGCDPAHESLFLGVITACEAQMGWASKACAKNTAGVMVKDVHYPPLGDHTFEWMDMASALEYNHNEENRFYMLELGAGWAKWIVDGVSLARRIGRKEIMAIGVEAQDQHCEWAEAHIQRNGVGNQSKLICGAVGSEDGFVEFPVAPKGDKGERFGLGIQFLLDGKRTTGGVKKIQAHSFCSLVNRDEFNGQPIDFVSLDVQSFEHSILSPTRKTLECLNTKVRVLHISLHRVEENDARQFANTFVGQLGWDLVRYYPLVSALVPTEFGGVTFTDGVLTFVNPILAPGLGATMYNAKNVYEGPYTKYKGKRLRESVAPDWKEGDYITDVKKGSIPWPPAPSPGNDS